jgi:nitrate reductase gamma subunit
MEQWLEFARGPLFIAAFSLMVLGLGRLFFMELIQMAKNWLGMKDRDVPWYQNFKTFIGWIIPVRQITKSRPFMSVTSFLFHVGLIVVPIFLAEHIILWRSGIRFGWPALGNTVADFLTLMTIVACVLLLAIRIFHRETRILSGFTDYALLIILLIPFVSGYMAMHPQWLFTKIQTMMLIHILSGELVFVLIPFTKMAHVILFPFDRVSSDFYWRFPADGPDRVAKALHGEEVKA